MSDAVSFVRTAAPPPPPPPPPSARDAAAAAARSARRRRETKDGSWRARRRRRRQRRRVCSARTWTPRARSRNRARRTRRFQARHATCLRCPTRRRLLLRRRVHSRPPPRSAARVFSFFRIRRERAEGAAENRSASRFAEEASARAAASAAGVRASSARRRHAPARTRPRLFSRACRARATAATAAGALTPGVKRIGGGRSNAATVPSTPARRRCPPGRVVLGGHRGNGQGPRSGGGGRFRGGSRGGPRRQKPRCRRRLPGRPARAPPLRATDHTVSAAADPWWGCATSAAASASAAAATSAAVRRRGERQELRDDFAVRGHGGGDARVRRETRHGLHGGDGGFQRFRTAAFEVARSLCASNRRRSERRGSDGDAKQGIERLLRSARARASGDAGSAKTTPSPPTRTTRVRPRPRRQRTSN